MSTTPSIAHGPRALLNTLLLVAPRQRLTSCRLGGGRRVRYRRIKLQIARRRGGCAQPAHAPTVAYRSVAAAPARQVPGPLAARRVPRDPCQPLTQRPSDQSRPSRRHPTMLSASRPMYLTEAGAIAFVPSPRCVRPTESQSSSSDSCSSCLVWRSRSYRGRSRSRLSYWASGSGRRSSASPIASFRASKPRRGKRGHTPSAIRVAPPSSPSAVSQPQARPRGRSRTSS